MTTKLTNVIGTISSDEWVKTRIIENATQGVARMLAASEDKMAEFATALRSELSKENPSEKRLEGLANAVQKLKTGVEDQRKAMGVLQKSYGEITGKEFAMQSRDERINEREHVKERAEAALAALAASA